MDETLWIHADKYDLDIVQCGIVGTGVTERPCEILDTNAFRERILQPILLQGKGSALVWDKLYRNQYNFGVLPLGDYGPWEDHALNLHFFQKVTRYGIVHKELYHYCVNSNSVTRNYNPKILVWFNNIVALRRKLASSLCTLDEYTDATWIMRSARNLFVMMSYVKFPSLKERYRKVLQLVGTPMIEHAYSVMRRRSLFRSRVALFWFVVSRCTWFSMIVISFAKWIQQNLKRRR